MDWLRRYLQPARPSTEEIRRYFEDAARDDEHYPTTIDPRIYHVKLVLDHLGDVSGKRIADLGCGKGRFARILKERSPDVRICALDLAENMLRHVPEGVDRCMASMTAIPLGTGTCDGAYATESLEHAVDIQKAVGELCRIVKPGGRIVVIDKNKRKWGKLETPRWEKWFGRNELEKLLGAHCSYVESREISYWEDVAPDGLFLAWLAIK